jgi:hypothetical protein
MSITVPPSAIAAFEAQLRSAPLPPRMPSPDLLDQVFEYYARERTTLASSDVVIAAAKEILRLREEVQVLTVALAARGRLLRDVVVTMDERKAAGQ